MTNTITDAPYWGHIDSTMDWCESNYVHTPYVAELLNSLTSVIIVIFGFFGLIQLIRYTRGERRFIVSFLGVALVGIGSTLFHATLRRWSQSMDEIPMMYGTLINLYIMLDTHWTMNAQAELAAAKKSVSNGHANGHCNGHTNGHSNGHANGHSNGYTNGHIITGHQQFDTSTYNEYHRTWLKIGLFVFGAVETLIYFIFQKLFIFFFLGYSICVLAMIAIMTYELFYKRPSTNVTFNLKCWIKAMIKERGSVTRALSPIHYPTVIGVIPEPAMSHIPSAFYYGANAAYFLGFAFWSAEHLLCPMLPSADWMFFHALWHVLAGFGCYINVEAQLAWRASLFRDIPRIETSLGVVPYVVLNMNGEKKQ